MKLVDYCLPALGLPFSSSKRLERRGKPCYPVAMSDARDLEGNALPPEELLAHASALYNLARHLTRHPTDAEDLVQETYVRAFASKARFDQGAHLKSWLFCILRHVFIDSYRRKRGQPLHTSLEEGEQSNSLPVSQGDPELDKLRSFVAEDLHAALLTLSDDARAAILLDLEGFTEQEMADILNCAPGTVKSRLARARSLLRIKLK